MSATANQRERGSVRILEADPGLGQALPPEERALAARYAVAQAHGLDPGPWDAGAWASSPKPAA